MRQTRLRSIDTRRNTVFSQRMLRTASLLRGHVDFQRPSILFRSPSNQGREVIRRVPV